ncbi:2OG-Fe dioxygenase family protein [Luteimonas kalidii]|uniref:2OG-Fe dioxygenase family protein n=1 Tax=Luteimonas kalidii TaxID=3042025 RepID=A0ABT6JY43_9GAMM|nr:2OG-Fe dioxygenase family protein [Luteimonas kalidii]MDH5835423.1 2OG-Fe dioxygenase family protein [Luteimonas kalidii]
MVPFPPPLSDPNRALDDVRARGYAVLLAEALGTIAQVDASDFHALEASWDDLPPDAYLRDGGRYRSRRHSCFVVDGAVVRQVPHRAHWQSLDYNALHGGMLRMFEPVAPQTIAAPAWPALISALAGWCSALKGAQPWHVEAHQFRIDTADGIGRPTPEGAHRDGVDFVAVILVERHAIKGGETRVFQAEGPDGQRFTLLQPWSLLFLDDARMIHESTPIQPESDDAPGHRDTLVLTFRAGAFQGDD